MVPALSKPTFKGRLARVASVAPDFLGPAFELINSREPKLSQRALNSLIVGAGDIGVSAVTLGADLPPSLLQLSRLIYDASEERPESTLGKFQKGAEVFDPENYLRIASQAIGQGTLSPTGEDVDFAVRNIEEGIKALNLDEPKNMPLAPIGGPMFMPRL